MSSLSFDFDYLRMLVQQQSAVVLGAEKKYLADLYLESVAAQAGFPSIEALVEHLKQMPLGMLHRQTVEALLTNETSFFRDRHPFEALKTRVIPELMEHRQQERSLKIWCAACSSGQEPYSIAMLIQEHFPELLSWHLQILASDMSGRVLMQLKQGCYSQAEVNRGLPRPLRNQYFRQQRENWQIDDRLRKMLTIFQLNLIQEWKDLPTMDIIFLRNVLIYFDTSTKVAILQKIQQHLRPDGYLFLGGGETVFNISTSFETLQIGSSTCHRLRL
jgi:chemotaxis protein methyltransferase CheR